MNKRYKTLTVAALLALVSAGLFAADAVFGAKGAEEKTGLSLEQMLTCAIQDEYLARAEYEAIMQRHGQVRPFSSILRAEEQLAMYQAFPGKAGSDPLPADVREVFERLQAASENHLRAFRNNLTRFN